MPTIPITWQNLTNAFINGDGDLEKNAGLTTQCAVDSSGTGDAGARSVETIAGGDWMFQCTFGPLSPDESGRTFMGIHHGTHSLDFADWDYCMHVSTVLNTLNPHPPNSVFVYRGPIPRKTYLNGVWEEGALLQLICQGGIVRAYLNCLLMYTFSNAPVYPIFAEASIACMNKTVIDPVFITGPGVTPGSICGIGDRGPDTDTDACVLPWTIPTPTAFPLPAAGGPQHAYFAEVDEDWGEDSNKFGDSKTQSSTIQTAPVRRFLVRWTGLSLAQAAVVDAHFTSTRGGLRFTLTNPLTSEVVTGVRYEAYGRSPHRKEWAQDREARLIKYTN